MIYIRETIPYKGSGLTSFVITFTYNEKLIEVVKTLPYKYYLSKEHAWEIPCTGLAEALDTLTYYDDIQLIMLPETEMISDTSDAYLTEKEIKEFKFSPFAHQIDAINFGLHPKHKKWLLLDSMGLG